MRVNLTINEPKLTSAQTHLYVQGTCVYDHTSSQICTQRVNFLRNIDTLINESKPTEGERTILTPSWIQNKIYFTFDLWKYERIIMVIPAVAHVWDGNE